MGHHVGEEKREEALAVLSGPLVSVCRKGEGVMALFKCPDCGREVSDKAKACPGCGVIFWV